VSNATYTETPKWFKSWENAGLIAWVDKNNDGKILYTKGNAMSGRPDYKDEAHRGQNGERTFNNEITSNENELWIDKDIMVLANPEIANLPNWVIALVVAGGLAAALSTAAGLLLVISTSVSHDLLKKILAPNISDKQELLYARLASAAAVVIAAYFGINPPGFVASVVAFAFGLAASSFFPLIIMGVFFKKMNREGAVSGMIVGMVFTASYIFYFKLMNPELNIEENWLFGISPEGIGTVGAALNFLVAIIVCSFTPPPPEEVQEMVERIRIPNAAGASKGGH
jgi:cation/acetate symporter